MFRDFYLFKHSLLDVSRLKEKGSRDGGHKSGNSYPLSYVHNILLSHPMLLFLEKASVFVLGSIQQDATVGENRHIMS